MKLGMKSYLLLIREEKRSVADRIKKSEKKIRSKEVIKKQNKQLKNTYEIFY